MHTYFQRLNHVFFFSLSCLGAFAFLAAATTIGHHPQPVVKLDVPKVMLRRLHGSSQEQAILTLAIDADLTSLFNWNVKMLFVFITAEYETEPNVLNQVVMWDHIVQARELAHLRYESVTNKYSLTDQGYGLKGNNVTLVLNWDVIPTTGLHLIGHSFDQTYSFRLPNEYLSAAQTSS